MIEETEKVLNSITNSKIEIEKYFNLKNPEYRCDSWLLSNQINAIIDSMSPEELKVYLKSMVKENMVVGMEIINAKK